MMAKTIFYIFVYAVFNVAGAALIKWNLRAKELNSLKEWFGFIFQVPFFVAFALILTSAFALFKALSTNHFSLVIPIATGINFMLTIGVGYFLFQDRLTFLSFLGLVLIITGILLLSLNNQTNA
jgi:multidrug transporter EmrE-like cation transporter